MAKAKINEAKLDDLNEHLGKAIIHLEEVDTIWGDNFQNLYNNFITNGFLNDLYEDAKSQYYNLANAGWVMSYVVQDAGLGMAIGGLIGAIIPIPVIDDVIGAAFGGIIGGVIGLFRGIDRCVKNPESVNWRYDAKQVLEELLLRCVDGNDDNYIAIYNCRVKQKNMELALLNLRQKVNEFQKMYANLTGSAKNAGVELKLASDNTTILGIKSEVIIDGKTIEIDSSEAMAAVYTYVNTAMNGVISAELISQEYGVEISYLDILKNTNALMTNTIESDLYSHEFINKVLPEYNFSQNQIVSKVSSILELDDTQVGSLLGNVSGVTNLSVFPAALGASLVGSVSAAIADKKKQEDEYLDNISDNHNNIKNPQDEEDVNKNNDTSSNSKPSFDNTSTTPPKKEEDNHKEEDTEESPEEDNNDNEENEVINDVEITEVVADIEIPEGLMNVEKIDYDKLASEEYEFGEKIESILERRADIITDIEDKINSGDYDSLREELEEYGYNNAEIDVILKDKDMLVNAILEGDLRSLYAQRAHELAASDGIEDFVSVYENRPDYTNLEYDGPNELLTLYAEDKGVMDAKANYDELKVVYNEEFKITSELLTKVEDNKTDMLKLKESFEKEFGIDTTKWTKEAAEKYNESIVKYNESVQSANAQIKVMEEAKTNYIDSRTKLDEVKSQYYEKLKIEYEEANQNIDSTSTDIIPDDTINNDAYSDQAFLDMLN